MRQTPLVRHDNRHYRTRIKLTRKRLTSMLRRIKQQVSEHAELVPCDNAKVLECGQIALNPKKFISPRISTKIIKADREKTTQKRRKRRAQL